MNWQRISKLMAGLALAIVLPACATASRGSHTVFKVETVPANAKVVTDLEYRGDISKVENAMAGEIVYYGCDATPCSIKLPRRSDFNIMIVKPGFQPATTAIIKERNKMAVRKTEAAGAGVVGTGAVVAGVATASAVASETVFSSIFFPAALTAPAVMVMAMPVVGAVTGVDLASGALIDLRPNPLQVELKPEVSEAETKELIAAFMNSRRVHSVKQ